MLLHDVECDLLTRIIVCLCSWGAAAVLLQDPECDFLCSWGAAAVLLQDLECDLLTRIIVCLCSWGAAAVLLQDPECSLLARNPQFTVCAEVRTQAYELYLPKPFYYNLLQNCILTPV